MFRNKRIRETFKIKKEFKIDKFPHLTYEKLIDVVNIGLFNRKVKGIQCDVSGITLVDGAVWNGKYMGSPGKDIYFMLPYLSEEQMKEVAIIMKNNFPKDPPENHLNVAACIRFIYGQFDKNGIFNKNNKIKENNDWELPRKFLNLLYKELEKDNNYYGLTILCEMEGHRLGDEAILNNNLNKLKEMEDVYNKAAKYATLCKSYKHMFTAYYWASKYFIKIGDLDKSKKYCKLTLENADKYCPDARDSYIDKLTDCFNYLKKNDKKYIDNFLKIKHKNKAIKRTINKK